MNPKQRFLADKPRVDFMQSLVVDPRFVDAVETALLQTVMELPVDTEPALAIAGYQRMVGAKLFLNQLMNIAEPPKMPTKTATSGQLRYD